MDVKNRCEIPVLLISMVSGNDRQQSRKEVSPHSQGLKELLRYLTGELEQLLISKNHQALN